VASAVFFHAHPDDEVLSTGGTMAKLAGAGHRVVLVTATRGELGECHPELLAPGEEVWERRDRELAEACALLGVTRRTYLDYRDSGMMGEEANAHPACFWQADVGEAAAALAAVLTEEAADVLTIYDDHGNYGHPDHIQVHRVGRRAAELAGVDAVYEATMNRDLVLRMLQELGAIAFDDPDMPPPEFFTTLGTPEAELTTCVDVRAQLEQKRAAMQAHASQAGDFGPFLSMPPEHFATMVGSEWFLRRGRPPGPPYGADILEDLG
jgi:LmbE family N-acetylglucosaminyl deacetylase